MHFKALLISTLLSSIPVTRAATSLADVNAANQALAKQADFNDAFVQKRNLVNVVTNGKTVSNEVAAFAQAVHTAYTNDRSAKAVEGEDQEETVILPYQELCTNTAHYMEDLGSKRNLLMAQRANILASLETLSIYFNDLSGVIQKLLPDGDFKEEEVTAHTNAQEKIDAAVTTYQSTVV